MSQVAQPDLWIEDHVIGASVLGVVARIVAFVEDLAVAGLREATVTCAFEDESAIVHGWAWNKNPKEWNTVGIKPYYYTFNEIYAFI